MCRLSISIIPGNDASGYYSTEDSVSPELESIVYASGYVAVRSQGATESQACLGCGDDFEKINELDVLALTANKSQALELMAQEENKAAVRCISKILLEQEFILSQDFEVCVELVYGNVS